MTLPDPASVAAGAGTPAPQALDVFDVPLEGSLLVEASAGTGKTWTLAALVLRLLLERGLAVQQVLVVSFTKATAAELRQRIRARLAELQAALQPQAAAQAGSDPFVHALLQRLDAAGVPQPLRLQRLQHALQHFDEAAIHTLHGWCQRALGDIPLASGMPLRQDLQEDDAALRLQLAQDFWRRHVAAAGLPPPLLATLVGSGDSPEAWAAQLKRRRAKPLAALKWPPEVDAASDTLDLATLQDAFHAAQQAWERGREDFLAKLQEARPRLNGTRLSDSLIATAIAQWDALLAGSDPLAETAPRTDADRLDRFTPKILAPKKNQAPMASDPFPAIAETLLALREATQQQLLALRLRLLRRWLSEGPALLRAAQQRLRTQTFDDLLGQLHQRLQAEGGATLSQALRERWPAVLVDEFQDTDPVQWGILQTVYAPLLDGSAAQAGMLVLVGDPKQAIYSFRHADLRTYLRARACVQQQATLGANQRSVPALIQACNALFGQHPRAFQLPGLDFHPVQPGAKPRGQLQDDAGTLLAAALQLWGLPAEPPLRKGQAQQAALQACAGQIVTLLAAAQAGTLRLDGRAVQAGDVAVLVRTHRQGAQMRQALAALGVGSIELSRQSLWDSADAEELAQVLAAVLAPQRTPLVRAALATDLLGLDAPALEALAADEPAFAAWLQRLQGWRSLWAGRGIGLMLRRLQAELALPARWLARADGERRLTNLLHLAECLQAAEQDHAAPEALLRWLQQQRQDPGGREGEATQLRLESDRQLVQIVTLHRSKGLEYPFVFLPLLWDGAAGLRRQTLDGVEGHDDDTGQAFIDFTPGPAKNDPRRAAATAEVRAENLRLVYVALTRAVQRCWLVVGPYVQGAHASAAQGRQSPLHWLLAGPEGAEDDAAQQAERWQRWAGQLQTAAPGSVSWAALPQRATGQPVPLLAAPAVDSQGIAAAPGPRQLPPAWRMGSYSGLMQGAQSLAAPALPESPAVDHDRLLLEGAGSAAADLEAAGTAAAEAPHEPAPGDILLFPRGASAGECLHAVFEHADSSAPASWPAAVDAALARHGAELGLANDAPQHRAAVLQMLQDVVHTPLLPAEPGMAALTLASITPAQRLNELEFTLPAAALRPEHLQPLLQQQGLAGPSPVAGRLATPFGYLRGYIDMVFEHGGRFHVLDWKSNHLGLHPADYAPPRLAAAMSAQGYHLQLLLYTVALHRWLQARLAGYDYERHVGPGLYLFVRGVRPGWVDAQGRPCGVHAWRAPLALVEACSALLGDAASAPGGPMLDELLAELNAALASEGAA